MGEVVCEVVGTRAKQFTAGDLANATWAVARLQGGTKVVACQLLEAVGACAFDFCPVDLVNASWALAKLQAVLAPTALTQLEVAAARWESDPAVAEARASWHWAFAILRRGEVRETEEVVAT